MTGCIKMKHILDALASLGLVVIPLGGVALFATFAAILFIGYGVGL